MAVAGNGAFASTGLSLHAETHVELIRRFLEIQIAVTKDPEKGVLVRFGAE
jgi:RNA 3'-terminal phosphate cyclase